jgi:catechol 2,3-dioxygenase-like lactoylglutathione lyase family enzyme
MLSHVHIGVSDFERAVAFYSVVLAELGLVVKFMDAQARMAGWQAPGAARPLLLVGVPYDGAPASPGNGQMIALLAPSRIAVEKCHAAALANGGADEGPPGLRPQYHPHYFGAYFRDPDGNKLCVCRHEPETPQP